MKNRLPGTAGEDFFFLQPTVPQCSGTMEQMPLEKKLTIDSPFFGSAEEKFWRILGKLKEKKGRKMADILAYYIAIYGHYDDCCDHYSSCLGRLTFSASGTSLLLRFSWNTESTKRERGAAVAAAPGGLTCLFSLFN